MNITMYGDAIASELLKNHSICVKEGNNIRNIKHYTELDSKLFVMVCNADYGDSICQEVLKGESVRYFKLKI